MNTQGRNADRDNLFAKLAANPDARKRMEEEVAELERKAELEKLRGPHPVESPLVIIEEEVHVPETLLERVFIEEALDQTRLIRAEKGLGFPPIEGGPEDYEFDHAMLLHAYKRCRIELVKAHERAERMHRRAQWAESGLLRLEAHVARTFQAGLAYTQNFRTRTKARR